MLFIVCVALSKYTYVYSDMLYSWKKTPNWYGLSREGTIEHMAISAILTAPPLTLYATTNVK